MGRRSQAGESKMRNVSAYICERLRSSVKYVAIRDVRNSRSTYDPRHKSTGGIEPESGTSLELDENRTSQEQAKTKSRPS